MNRPTYSGPWPSRRTYSTLSRRRMPKKLIPKTPEAAIRSLASRPSPRMRPCPKRRFIVCSSPHGRYCVSLLDVKSGLPGSAPETVSADPPIDAGFVRAHPLVFRAAQHVTECAIPAAPPPRKTADSHADDGVTIYPSFCVFHGVMTCCAMVSAFVK